MSSWGWRDEHQGGETERPARVSQEDIDRRNNRLVKELLGLVLFAATLTPVLIMVKTAA